MSWYEDLVANASPKPEPVQSFYSRHGDCIEFFSGSGAYYGQRIDGLVTVYVSEETGEPVGILMKGVRGFLSRLSEKMPNTRCDFAGGGFSLEYLLTAYIWTKDAADDSPSGTSNANLKLLFRLRDVCRSSEIKVNQDLIEC